MPITPLTPKRWLALGAVALVMVATTLVTTDAFAVPGATITGHVLDNGSPVANVTVQARPTGNTGPVPPVTTDSTGAFSLVNIPIAVYRISFRLPGGSTTFYSPGATSYETAGLISVGVAETLTLEESVPAHGAISGRLTRSNGSGVQSSVQAFGPAGTFFTNTDATGAYTLPYIWLGTYKVVFSPSGAPTQYAHQQTDSAAAQTFDVTAGATTVVDDTLVPTGMIRGLLTKNGAPAAFSFVTVFATTPYLQSVASATSGPDGTYQVSVVPGTYAVKVQFPGGLSQYAHGQVSLSTADQFTVVEGQSTVVDEQALIPGTIQGTLTNPDGSPASGLSVAVKGESQSYNASLNAAGSWSVAVLPGVYSVSFGSSQGVQYAYGQSSQETANSFTVGPSTTVVVNDVLLAPGSATFTATDRATGAALQSFCAILGNGSACTTTGTLTIARRAGRYNASVYTQDQSYVNERTTVTVLSGQDTSVALQLAKAATLTTVVKDAETGAPVAGACVQLVSPVDPTSLTRNGGACSGVDGVVNLRGIRAGAYNAFVNVHDGVHGAQWVGLVKGVGAQIKSRLILAGDGAAITLPAIKLDRTATITGTITDAATGKPIEQAFAGVASFIEGRGDSGPGDVTNSAGRYTITGLGPYSWTLFFRSLNHASVFTGGTGDRFLASGTSLSAGQTATYDLTMRAGTTFTGTVLTGNGMPVNTRITLVHALTGDELYSSDVHGGAAVYSLQVASPLLVKLRYDSQQFVGGADFQHAQVFLVGNASPQVQNITVEGVGNSG